MTEIANLIDYFLYAVLVLTLGLSAFKVFDLWLPQVLGRAPASVRLGATPLELDEGLESMESGLTLLALIAAIAPFVGLSGTVIHIMEALRAMGSAGADIAVISGPVVTALNATLVGLASAVPAAIAHSLMVRRIQVLENRQRRKF